MNETQRKQDMIELVKNLMNSVYIDEGEEDVALEKLLALSPDPDIANLIYYPDQALTPEDIVEKAFQHKPIVAGWNG